MTDPCGSNSRAGLSRIRSLIAVAVEASLLWTRCPSGGLLLNAFCGWSWADPGAALIMSPIFATEALKG